MTANAPAAGGPKLECEKEIRFAIVMYGGVSLAVYINGVAQELLHLVRATAEQVGDPADPRAPGAASLTHTERVYRKVAYLLGEAALREGDLPARLDELETRLGQDKPLYVQFVIDILSGTSAGGINAIFLAKALAKDQSMRQLQSLWVSEGDIGKLIQDSRSVETPFTLKQPPASLLNSQRMYIKLLEAFDGMEPPPNRPATRPALKCAKELDLFITTTDIRGTTLPICLADKPVFERRHRNVFHFRHANGESDGDVADDFASDNNPFLAYSARCTSAFPFAFEPMSLGDVDAVLSAPRFQKYKRSEEWKKFFDDYKGVNADSYTARFFGDGGYLDNKPFSYAIDTLQQRQPSFPTERKLLYIEPSPEHPESEVTPTDKPNALQNSTAALLVLPRYETIREDLRRVIERNRLIERINHIIAAIERATDLASLRLKAPQSTDPEKEKKKKKEKEKEKLSQCRKVWRRKRMTDEEWGRLDFADMIQQKDPAYVAYHCLEVSAVTDDLARLVASVLQFDEESDYLLAIRSLVRAWRERVYTKYRAKRGQIKMMKPTMNQFLLDFGLDFKFRRLNFVRGKIDELFASGERAKAILGLLDISSNFLDDRASETRKGFREELKWLRQVIRYAYAKLLEARKMLRSQGLSNPVAARIQTIGITPEILGWILGENQNAPPGVSSTAKPSNNGHAVEQEANQRAKDLLEQKWEIGDALIGLGQELAARLRQYTVPADAFCLTAINATGNNPVPKDVSEDVRRGIEAARECISYYYQLYDIYDEMIYPIIYSTNVGEASPVQIYRISPEDATSLIDENNIDENQPNSKCKKLAGVSLGHFGAFFEQRWRENDILWGRLDGAERIITALLPDNPKQARRLIGEAQAAIICDAIDRESEAEKYLYTLLSESLMRTASGRPEGTALTQFIKRLKENAAHPALEKKLNRVIREGDLSDHYRKIFPTHRQLTPEIALQSAARATTVVGQMLKGISDQHNQQGKRAAVWVTRAGQFFWGLVEVAVPRSFTSVVFRYWLNLLHWMAALLIVAGILGLSGAQSLGWKALAITLGVRAVVLLLSDVMRGRLLRWRILRAALIVAVIALAVLGVVEFQKRLWPKLTALIPGRDPRPLIEYYWQQKPALVTGVGLALGALLLVALIQRGPEYVRRLSYRFASWKQKIDQRIERMNASL
jgi:patatin-related protein